MSDSASARQRGDIDAAHTAVHADPADHSGEEGTHRAGILFLLILTVATILVFAGFLFRVFTSVGA